MKLKLVTGSALKQWTPWLKGEFHDNPLLLDQLFNIVESFHNVTIAKTI
jgi:hypothetical protein